MRHSQRARSTLPVAVVLACSVLACRHYDCYEARTCATSPEADGGGSPDPVAKTANDASLLSAAVSDGAAGATKEGNVDTVDATSKGVNGHDEAVGDDVHLNAGGGGGDIGVGGPGDAGGIAWVLADAQWAEAVPPMIEAAAQGSAPDAGGEAASGTGGPAFCGQRDCRSSLDNNCNGVPDNTEAECVLCAVSSSRSCSTGLKGICAAGTQSCSMSSDHSSVAWGDCVRTQMAGRRNCESDLDNDCDGTNDATDSACTVCAPGQTVSCDPHAEDGVGLCKPGRRSCVISSDKTNRYWGDCTGSVGPSTESCGPNAPADSNCDGVVGDGAGCLSAVKILYQSENSTDICKGGNFWAEMKVSANDEAGWSTLGTYKVFGSQGTGMTPLVLCRHSWMYYEDTHTEQYVTVTQCASTDTQVSTIGYLGAVSGTGYRSLQTVNIARVDPYAYHLNGSGVPVFQCPSGCTCTTPTNGIYIVP